MDQMWFRTSMQERLVYERLNHLYSRSSKFHMVPLGSGKPWALTREIFCNSFQNIENYIKILPFLAYNMTKLTSIIIPPSENNDFAMHIKYLWRFETNIIEIKLQQ